MKPIVFSLVLLFSVSATAVAQSLNNYLWKSRLVLLFTPEPDDPMFERQVKLLLTQTEAFEERDVIFMFITPDGKFENTGRFLAEADARKFYDKFSVAQYQLELVLVGLDGTEKFRAKNRITPPSVLLELIDGMPMRKRELLQGYGNRSKVGENEKPPVKSRRKY